jgi:hypothetical protein
MTGPAAGRSISLRFGVTYPCPSPGELPQTAGADGQPLSLGELAAVSSTGELVQMG